jgi:hypothetical protein
MKQSPKRYSVNEMQHGDEKIHGKVCPWLTYNESQELQIRYPKFVTFKKCGQMYEYRTLEPKEMNLCNMHSMNAHVSFITEHETQVIIRTPKKNLKTGKI